MSESKVKEKKGMRLSSPEYYRLVCCGNNKPIVLNEELIIFEFTGEAYNENYPDKFLNKIIGNIETLSKIKIKGCWYLEDANLCDKEIHKVIDWKSFFTKVSIFECCEECMPDEDEEERIYLKTLVPVKPKSPHYNIIKDYVNYWYKDALQRMEGIKVCCPPDKNKALINYNVFIRESLQDKFDCCSPCVQVRVTVPENSNGSYSYNNCENERITVDVDTNEELVHIVCVCVNNYTGINFVGTLGGDFIVNPLGIPCV